MLLEVLVEIPKGSRNKYEFDPEKKRLRFDRMLSSEVHYPSDYGFIPETLAEDGDALDALVLLWEPTFPGCLIEVRPIGLFKMWDAQEPDHKILCVPIDDPLWNHLKELEQVPSHLLEEIEHFFSSYKDLKKKGIEVEGWEGRDRTERVIEAAQRRYREEKAVEETPPPAICHIVVVDDEERERETLADLVRGEGYRVTEAGGGQEALVALGTEPVDLVLTELIMADIDGWELLDRAKKIYPQTHVVVITGNITEQGEALLASRKADGYLVKPVQKRPLQILLRALLAPGNLDRAAEVVAVSGDQAMLQLIDETLAERGVSVRSISDVRKAVAAIWHDPPDLVLTELAIGRESGFDLCERIRSSLQIPPLPILLLAGQSSQESVRRAVQLRVNGILLTPFASDDLVERVFKLMRQAGQRPQKTPK